MSHTLRFVFQASDSLQDLHTRLVANRQGALEVRAAVSLPHLNSITVLPPPAGPNQNFVPLSTILEAQAPEAALTAELTSICQVRVLSADDTDSLEQGHCDWSLLVDTVCLGEGFYFYSLLRLAILSLARTTTAVSPAVCCTTRRCMRRNASSTCWRSWSWLSTSCATSPRCR